jgi:hypothetical protein
MVEAVQLWAEPVTLSYLRHHWGAAYVVDSHGRTDWTARRRDGLGAVLRARRADELLELIRLDYQNHPVSR